MSYSQLFPASRLEDISYDIHVLISDIEELTEKLHREQSRLMVRLSQSGGFYNSEVTNCHKSIDNILSRRSEMTNKKKELERQALELMSSRKDWVSVHNSVW
ncbi:MAG: hypothetical protein [Bacteriophage sp.]|nr:MAG: hypothetical protein [Bacteriophage sp.]